MGIMAEVATYDPDTKKVGPLVETSVPNPLPPPISSLPEYTPPSDIPPENPEPIPGPPELPPDHPPHHPPDHRPVPEWRTINITLQINFPGTWRWPRCKRRRRDGPPHPPPSPTSLMNALSTSAPRKGLRSPLAWLIFWLVVFYVSFLICGAVSWGIRDSNSDLRINEAVVIMSTFIPIVDAFAVGALIHLFRKNPDNAKPGFRWVFAILFNEIMFVFNLVVLIFASIWTRQINDHNPYYWIWRSPGQHRAIAGMTLYNSVTMIFFKFCLLFHILRWPDIRKTVKDSFTQLCGDECEYTKVSNYDPDARNVRQSTDAVRTSEEGRIYLS